MDLFHSIEFTFSKLEKEKGARLFSVGFSPSVKKPKVITKGEKGFVSSLARKLVFETSPSL